MTTATASTAAAKIVDGYANYYVFEGLGDQRAVLSFCGMSFYLHRAHPPPVATPPTTSHKPQTWRRGTRSSRLASTRMKRGTPCPSTWTRAISATTTSMRLLSARPMLRTSPASMGSPALSTKRTIRTS
jgi:hypothetical protein